jgi:hypothetical protein
MRNKSVDITAILLAFISLGGCTSTQSRLSSEVVEVVSDNRLLVPEGSAEFLWEEPQVEIAEVSPGLDEQGFYYNPKYYTISPAKQGRWRYYRRD